MLAFGWTIEYTLALSFPQFVGMIDLARRARADAAINGFYVPYIAAKFGGDASRELFSTRGSLFLEDIDSDKVYESYTEEQLEEANRRMLEIIQRKEQAVSEIVEGVQS